MLLHLRTDGLYPEPQKELALLLLLLNNTLCLTKHPKQATYFKHSLSRMFYIDKAS